MKNLGASKLPTTSNQQWTATVIGVIEAKEIEPRLKKAKTWNESSGASPG